MNNKGFTLIELILVIAIIALLALVFTPNVLNLINKNNTNAYNSILSSVESAAESYISNNRYDSEITSQINCNNNETEITGITLQKLFDAGDLSKMPTNPCDNSELEFSENDEVDITFNCTTKQFSYEFRNKILEEECKNRG